MAGPNRNAVDPLTSTSPNSDARAFFDFVRERLDAARHGGRDGTIGGDTPPSREPLRFGAAAGQRSAAEEITIVHDADRGPGEVTVNFMGLTGPSGVLPDHYTEQVVDQRRERELSLAAFLDLFNHRAVSQFWRAWAKYRLPVAFASDDGRLADPFSGALKALAGLGVAGEAVADESLLSASGALARRVRSAGALRRILFGIFHLPVEVSELEGRWVELGHADRTRLGAGGPKDSRFATLSVDTVVGAAVWDVGSRFRVRVGPLDFATFRSFFDPTGPRRPMIDTIRRTVGGNVDFTVQLVLRRDDVPMLRLDDPAAPNALGQSTWLLAGPATGDRDEAILTSVMT